MVGTLVMLTAAGTLAWALARRQARIRNVALLGVAVGFGLAQFEASVPGDYEPSRLGLSEGRVERECRDGIYPHLSAPDSMQFRGNPVDAAPVWDEAAREWRWIMDVTAENAFGVRVHERFQCVVTTGPTFTVRPVD